MGRNHAEKLTPDLFSTDAVQGAAVAPPRPPPTEATESKRHILSKNLRYAVKQLSDGDLDQLFEVAFDEAKRRGRLPRNVPVSSSGTDKSTRPRKVEVAEVSLTRGQLNAVRAAFKAGITPSRIARQFGLSQSNVRKALTSE
jgi:predicted DNA-binding protein (UPF0251 family)